MLLAQKIRDLNLLQPATLGGSAFISAASGLVGTKERLYVIADDELHLGVFSLDPQVPGNTFPLFSGTLPTDPKARKKIKPDLESLIFLHADCAPTPDLLLAIPSGSTQNRTTGATITLGPVDTSVLSVQKIDFSPLYSQLSKHFPELNIEGAALSENSLNLFQRGNGSKGNNAIIELGLEQALLDLKSGRISPQAIKNMTYYDLGSLKGVQLSFTDAAACGNGEILFTAVAEDSADTYSDGACTGSVIGLLDRNKKLLFIEEISPQLKVEGIFVKHRGVKGIEVLLVTDDDNPNKAAELSLLLNI